MKMRTENQILKDICQECSVSAQYEELDCEKCPVETISQRYIVEDGLPATVAKIMAEN